MAKFNLLHMVAGKLTESNVGARTYATGCKLAKLVTANVTPNVVDSAFFADGEESESLDGISGGTIAFNVECLDDTGENYVFGSSSETTNSLTVHTAKSDDIAPYLGVAFIFVERHGGADIYRTRFYTKCKFMRGAENHSTKNGSPQLVGTDVTCKILVPMDKVWRLSATFTGEGAEASARTWCNTQVGYVG